MIAPLRLWLSLAMLSAILGGVWYVKHLRDTNATLTAAISAETMKLNQCVASLGVAREDRRRDDEIDRIPDHALRDAAREWLLEPAPSGGAAPVRP